MSHIARSSLIIAFFFAIDKALGFVRQIFIARQFGLTYEIDVFNAANNIPDLLSALISGGALGIALLPVLSEHMQKGGRPAAWDLFVRILNLAFLVTAAFSVIIALLARPLMETVIAPGFPPAQQALAVELLRLDLVAIIIFSISGLAMAGLQANQHFLLPAMAPALYNLGQIFGVMILVPAAGTQLGPFTLPGFDLGIHGLVYGVIIGALLHLAIQIPGLLRFGFRWSPIIGLWNPGTQQVLRLMGPRILTMFFIQLFFIVRDNLASGLGEGAVTALNYGWFLMQVPETLIGTAIAIALLPTLSEQISRGDRDAFMATLNRAIRALVALTLPVAILMAVGIRPLIQAFLGFDAAGTEMVVWATRAYLLGLTGHTLLEISARSFYAQQNARIPLYAAIINAATYIVLAVSLSRYLGPTGIALANSLAFTSEAFLLLYLLNRRFPGILRIGNTIPRIAAAAAGAGLVVYLLLQFAPFPMLPLVMVAMVLGVLLVLPFAWTEVKSLVHL